MTDKLKSVCVCVCVCVRAYSATLSRDYWDLDVLGRGAESFVT
jgi:hypothetical protein